MLSKFEELGMKKSQVEDAYYLPYHLRLGTTIAFNISNYPRKVIRYDNNKTYSREITDSEILELIDPLLDPNNRLLRKYLYDSDYLNATHSTGLFNKYNIHSVATLHLYHKRYLGAVASLNGKLVYELTDLLNYFNIKF